MDISSILLRSSVKNGALAFLLLFLLEGCANIVPPSGGPKDLTKPKLISLSPPDSGINQKIDEIELRFNKYMLVQNLQENMEISPLMDINPTVISYGKRVEIKLIDTLLKDSTTYRLSLGDALVGNRENNPYEDFVYIFSTGSYFDSLKLQGKVYDAMTGLPDSSATIVLYASDADDSTLLRKKPVYAQKVDATGNFSFSLLPDKPFRVYAIGDDNHNLRYDMWKETVDFADTLIIPTAANDSFYVFHVFKELPPDDSAAVEADSLTNNSLRGRISESRGKGKNQPLYIVAVDTTRPNQRTAALTHPLIIQLHTRLAKLDSSKVYLSYEDDGIDVQAIQTLSVDSGQIKIKTQWLEDRLYILRLVKGWATDTSGAELPPGKYRFRTKRSADYSTLTVHIADVYQDPGHVLFIYRGEDTVYQKPVTSATVSLSLLTPGSYQMRMIIDGNRNGHWDPGILFQQQHAETVIPYPHTLVLKAGWDNEVDFKEQKNDPAASRPDASIRDRSNQPDSARSK